ncbi:MAG TPA: DUF2723 domain-containing protein [Vicinamibacterales bacterium]
MTRHTWTLALGLVFLTGHLPWLAPALEDVDSQNFALALRDFNPALHQPHPPGYPVFILLGKLARVVGLSEAHALAVWGPIFGVLAVVALVQLFRAVEGANHSGAMDAASIRPALATLLTVMCPLFWFTAVRPMSDIPGLTLALLAQALLATAFWRQQALRPDDRATLVASGRLIVLGAFVAALALGVRVQTIWLTAPLFLMVIVHRIGRDAAGALLGSSLAFSIGVLLWAVPMIVAAGGWAAYTGALGSQAGEDFTGVDMLARNPTPRRLALGLLHTLVFPWGSTAFGGLMVGLLVLGALTILWRAPRSAMLLGVTVVPYAIFHLIFQETVTTRYALPVVPAFSLVVVHGLSSFKGKLLPVGTAVLAVWAGWIGLPAVSAYADGPSPAFRALGDMEAAARNAPGMPTVGVHHVFQRAVEAAQPQGIRMLPSPPKREWLEVVKYLLNNASGPLWFLADPMRTDLALFDPRSVTVKQSYRWPPELAMLVSGVRPTSVDWVQLTDPGWFVAEGWALTPETAGVAATSGRNPAQGSIEAYLRRRTEPLALVVGGRNLAAAGQGSARIVLTVDGHEVEQIVAPPGFFLRLSTLPGGTGNGADQHAKLEIAAEPANPGAVANVAIEQFNVQKTDEIVWGFETGWQEPEFNPATGLRWRWTSDHADIAVHETSHDLVLTLTGESPRRYFSQAPRVVVRAGARVLAEASPFSDFEIRARVPAGVLRTANFRLTIETSETFVPAERTASLDRRRLGLRIFKLTLEKARS